MNEFDKKLYWKIIGVKIKWRESLKNFIISRSLVFMVYDFIHIFKCSQYGDSLFSCHIIQINYVYSSEKMYEKLCSRKVRWFSGNSSIRQENWTYMCIFNYVRNRNCWNSVCVTGFPRPLNMVIDNNYQKIYELSYFCLIFHFHISNSDWLLAYWDSWLHLRKEKKLIII